MDDNTRRAALDYHRYPQPGKLRIEPTKRMVNQRDLALAYSPGVAAPCVEIATDPDKAMDYTARGNLVAVISNGTAILGLGNLGHMASKPVMEGKSVLFKRFADVDSFDVQVKTTDPDEFITVVKNIGDTWGGINLEDIKSPECFVIESELQDLLDIPVFHDDQHGTAIISAAGLINALAHITGGGLLENVPRVLPEGAHAIIDADAWDQPRLMAFLQAQGNIEPEEMARTFNCGVGMVLAVDEAHVSAVCHALEDAGETVFRIGAVQEGDVIESAKVLGVGIDP